MPNNLTIHPQEVPFSNLTCLKKDMQRNVQYNTLKYNIFMNLFFKYRITEINHRIQVTKK